MTTTTNEIVLRLEKPGDALYKSVIPLSSKRLLHPEVEQFLFDEAEDINKGNAIEIVIQLKQNDADSEKLIPIIHQHFKKQEEAAVKEVKSIVRLGWKGLIIAFAFLIAMYLLSRLLFRVMEASTFVLSVREFFIILSWVALWRPAELLLYEWRPVKEKGQYAAKLARATIRIV